MKNTLAERFYNKLDGRELLKYINICNYMNKYPNSKLAKDVYKVWENKNK